MKPDNLAAICELIRALTPNIYGLTGATIIFLAIINSERLIGDRFVYVVGAGSALGAAGAGGFSPQNRQSQNRIDAERVDIDQSPR